ncbi:MAG: glycosyltransferase [Bacteroidetes bacterium]|nr:MAG: glycosyltransferase [Bacteroidota bacterium]
MPISKSDVLISFPLSRGGYYEIVDEIVDLTQSKNSSSICIANVHMAVTAFQDRKYASIIQRADVVTPDGMPLTWALRLLYGVRQERVAGMDLLPDLLYKAEVLQIPVYFYGGTESMLGLTRNYIESHYPGILIAGMYSPPFRTLSIEEEEEVANRINESGAKLVFVVLGCPKQERWIAAMKDKVHAVMLGVGGALPVLIGLQKRAPLWMQRSGLEWFYRLSQEPKRLFKRYAVTNSLFLLLIVKEFIRIKVFRRAH